MYKQAILRLKTKSLSLPTVGKHPMLLLTSVDAEDTHQATILTRLGFTSHQKHITQNEMLLSLPPGKGICTQALMEQLLQMPIAAGALLLLALLWVSQFEHYNNTKK